MRVIPVALFFSFLLPIGTASGDSNPYIALYEARVASAKFEWERLKDVVENERILAESMKKLAREGAVTEVDADSQQTKYWVTFKSRSIAGQQLVLEANLLEIAKQRIEAGLDMPVCKSDDATNSFGG